MHGFYRHDWLEIYDGSSLDAPLIRGQKFCGDIAPEQFIVSSTNQLLLRFNSYHESSQRGYHIKVTVGKLKYF
jgi:hypothetical protein